MRGRESEHRALNPALLVRSELGSCVGRGGSKGLGDGVGRGGPTGRDQGVGGPTGAVTRLGDRRLRRLAFDDLQGLWKIRAEAVALGGGDGDGGGVAVADEAVLGVLV